MTDRAEVRPAIGSRDDLERPGALRAAVAELTALAVAGVEAPVDRLRAIGSPEALDVLFRVALGRLLRRGPAGAGKREPGALARPRGGGRRRRRDSDRDAGRLAGLSRVPGRCAAGERCLGAGGAALVVAASRSESARRAVGEPGADAAGRPGRRAPAPRCGRPRRPRRRAGAGSGLARVAAGPAAGVAGAHRLRPPPRKRRAVSPCGSGRGRGDRRSSRRSDEVRYLTGLEQDLLARAPALAVLVQHLLDRVEERLRRVLPGRELHAPQTAMLARYAAPTSGFAPHLDNPGGADDNGRAFTLVLYLNAPERPCRGGELSLWPAGAPAGEPPAVVLPPAGGSAVLFDARTVPHAVGPLEPGPDRWTLVLWWSARPRRPPRPLVPVPAPSAAEALLAVEDPPVVPGAVLFRRLDRAGADTVEVHRPAPARRPRVGVVATVGGGVGGRRLVPAPSRARRGSPAPGAGRRRGGRGGRRVRTAPPGSGRRPVDRLVGRRGATPALRLGAVRGLRGAGRRRRARGGDLGRRRPPGPERDRGAAGCREPRGDPLGRRRPRLARRPGRRRASSWKAPAGGACGSWSTSPPPKPRDGARSATSTTSSLPWRPGEPARFKRNPALASARLGAVGWGRLARHLGMEQADPRPYFRAYWNGKGAVAVSPDARAAGVHGWHVPGGPEPPLSPARRSSTSTCRRPRRSGRSTCGWRRRRVRWTTRRGRSRRRRSSGRPLPWCASWGGRCRRRHRGGPSRCPLRRDLVLRRRGDRPAGGGRAPLHPGSLAPAAPQGHRARGERVTGVPEPAMGALRPDDVPVRDRAAQTVSSRAAACWCATAAG